MAGSCPSDRDLRISFCEFSSGYHHERINVTDKISLVVIIIIVIIIVIIIIVFGYIPSRCRVLANRLQLVGAGD